MATNAVAALSWIECRIAVRVGHVNACPTARVRYAHFHGPAPGLGIVPSNCNRHAASARNGRRIP